jgi:hypothetical protein
MPRMFLFFFIAFAIVSSGHVFTAEQSEPSPAIVGPQRTGDDAGPNTNGGGFQPRQLSEPRAAESTFGFSLGFVASFGTFSVPHLPSSNGRAMFLANSQYGEGYFFFDGSMTYEFFAVDPISNVEGRVYRVDLPDSTVRHFLFGARNECCRCGIWQRCLIVYDHNWNRVNSVLANVGRTHP